MTNMLIRKLVELDGEYGGWLEVDLVKLKLNKHLKLLDCQLKKLGRFLIMEWIFMPSHQRLDSLQKCLYPKLLQLSRAR